MSMRERAADRDGGGSIYYLLFNIYDLVFRLPRRFAPRNDGLWIQCVCENENRGIVSALW